MKESKPCGKRGFAGRVGAQEISNTDRVRLSGDDCELNTRPAAENAVTVSYG